MFHTGQVEKPEEYQLQLVEYEIIEGSLFLKLGVEVLQMSCDIFLGTEDLHLTKIVARVEFTINSKTKKHTQIAASGFMMPRERWHQIRRKRSEEILLSCGQGRKMCETICLK